jgi:Domain of unknown function (DUF4209)
MNTTSKLQFPSNDEISATIELSEQKRSRDLSRVFGEKADTSGDDDWKLLQQVFNFHFKPSQLLEPFGPMMVADGKRSMIPADLTDEQLDDLDATLEGVADPEYRARIGDVLWLRRKNVHAARLAVEAYLEAGKRVEHPNNWNASVELYERAIRLARQIEPKGELPKFVLSHLESRVMHYDGTDPLYFTCKALEFLAEFRFGNFVDLAEIAGRVAEKSRAKGDFRRARSHYDVQAKHLKLAKDSSGVEIVRIAAARTIVEEAENREAKNEFMAAHTFWGDAIVAFKDRPSLRKEVPELQRRYSVAGDKLRSEMRTISSDEVDISKFVEQNRAIVSNLPWADAFFTFVTSVQLIDPVELRESATKEISDHPLQSVMASSIHDESGRKIGVRPSAFTEDKEQYEKAVLGFMEQNARIHRHFTIHANIAPMLRQLIDDYDIDQSSIAAVLDDSGLIPEERREWFYEAFVAGFRWDFSTALHVLIPQVENALRHVLQQRGISPVNIDAEGVEEVWGIERVLADPLTLETFGDRFVFELKSLLVERLGPNLRNLFAHGTLSPNGFRGETAFYLWWVILRIASYPTSGMHGFIERMKTIHSKTNTEMNT